MLTRNGRLVALGAVCLALVALVSLAPDSLRDAGRSQPVPASETRPPPDGAPNEIRASGAAASVRAPSVPRVPASAPDASRAFLGTQVQVQLHAPSTARVGEMFDADIHVEAPVGVREMLLTIRFDKKRLSLAGVTEGDFARRGGPPAEFAADEPSDGNVQVSLTVRDGLWVAGAGSFAVLRLEALAAGTVAITAQDLTAVDSTGARVSVPFLHKAAITIH